MSRAVCGTACLDVHAFHCAEVGCMGRFLCRAHFELLLVSCEGILLGRVRAAWDAAPGTAAALHLRPKPKSAFGA